MAKTCAGTFTVNLTYFASSPAPYGASAVAWTVTNRRTVESLDCRSIGSVLLTGVTP
jgi:hypothetical protein